MERYNIKEVEKKWQSIWSKKKIDSVNLESKLVGNLEENRRRLQRDFSRTRKIENVPISTHRLLQLASGGDVGIAKSEALEQLRFNLGNKEILEILAILETYEQESLQNLGAYSCS